MLKSECAVKPKGNTNLDSSRRMLYLNLHKATYLTTVFSRYNLTNTITSPFSIMSTHTYNHK